MDEFIDNKYEVSCPKCVQQVLVRRSETAQLARCKSCSHIFQVQGQAAPAGAGGYVPGAPAQDVGGYVPGAPSQGAGGYVPGAPAQEAGGYVPGAPSHDAGAYAPGGGAGDSAAQMMGGAPSATMDSPFGAPPAPYGTPANGQSVDSLDTLPSNPGMTTDRKVYFGIALTLGLWSATMAIISVAAASILPFESEMDIILFGQLATLVGFLPGLIGLGLAICPFEKNLRNPGWLWTAPAVTGIGFAMWMFLIVAGAMADDPTVTEGPDGEPVYDWSQYEPSGEEQAADED